MCANNDFFHAFYVYIKVCPVIPGITEDQYKYIWDLELDTRFIECFFLNFVEERTDQIQPLGVPNQLPYCANGP